MPVFARPGGVALLLAAVLAAGAAAFAPGLGNGWVWDDIIFIQNNRALDDLGNIPRILLSGDAVGLDTQNPYYRPLTTITFLLGKVLLGNHPAWAHGVNLLTHLAVCALFLLLLLRLTRRRGAALAAGLLFAVHPAHAEPVSYVSARGDLLAGLFVTGSLLAFLHFRDRRKRPLLALSLLLFLFGLLSKEVALVLPLLVGGWLALEARAGRRRWLLLLPFLGVAAGYLLLRGWVLEVHDWGDAGVAARIATAGFTLGENLKHILFPWTLKAFYGEGMRGQLLAPAVAAGWAAFAGILALAAAGARRAPAASLGAIWLLAALLPVSGLVGAIVPSMLADRFLYLPLLGVGLAAAGLFDRFLDHPGFLPGPRAGRAAAALLAAVVLACAAGSARRAGYWRDGVTLWSRAAADAGANALVLTNLGSALAKDGRLKEAEQAYRNALPRGGNRALIYSNLGWLYLQQGRVEDGRYFGGLSLQASPGNVGATLLLAECCRLSGDAAQAAALLGQARRKNPHDGRIDEVLRKLTPAGARGVGERS